MSVSSPVLTPIGPTFHVSLVGVLSYCFRSSSLPFSLSVFLFINVCVPHYVFFLSSYHLLEPFYPFLRDPLKPYATGSVLQMCSPFVISSLRINAPTHRSILISFTQIRVSFRIIVAHVSYGIAGLITVFQTLDTGDRANIRHANTSRACELLSSKITKEVVNRHAPLCSRNASPAVRTHTQTSYGCMPLYRRGTNEQELCDMITTSIAFFTNTQCSVGTTTSVVKVKVVP